MLIFSFLDYSKLLCFDVLNSQIILSIFPGFSSYSSLSSPLIRPCIISNSSLSSSCTVSSVANTCQLITSNVSVAFAQVAVGRRENLQYTPSAFICFENWVDLHLMYCSMKEMALFDRQGSHIVIVVSDSHWIYMLLSTFSITWCYFGLVTHLIHKTSF